MQRETSIPVQSLAQIFVRFLRFGCLAWGGPVAQIAMLRQALVEEERWVSSEHFNRTLALYQVLPGPEAHELCVYFGMLARGRLGGILAGLGFMLPGFVLMFALSWAYVHFGLDVHGAYASVFAAVQAAVAALIVRAVHKIGSHVLHDAWTWIIALLAFASQLLNVHFALTLAAGGFAYVAARIHRAGGAFSVTAWLAAIIYWSLTRGAPLFVPETLASAPVLQSVSTLELFWYGLQAGLLTFGGAYTAIPLLQRQAVHESAWMSNEQFLDGIALSGLLPAPLIIFTTFVGYLGGGASGALAMTVGTFLPAFAMTLTAHEPLDRLVHDRRMRSFLEGVTAAVVGLIAGTALTLLVSIVEDALTAAVFSVALAALILLRKSWATPLVIAAAAAVGFIVMLSR